jgi:hypothetical protein
MKEEMDGEVRFMRENCKGDGTNEREMAETRGSERKKEKGRKRERNS